MQIQRPLQMSLVRLTSELTMDTWSGDPQVLATVNVTGEAINEQPASPEPWNYIQKEQEEIDAWMAESQEKLDAGKLKQRKFVWSAMDGAYDYDPTSFADNDPATFEGAYRINGRYFGHTPQESVVAMPMLEQRKSGPLLMLRTALL